MTFKSPREMMQALVDGKRIRGKHWDDGQYIYLSEKGFLDERGVEYYDWSCTDDMEIYTEPKKPLELWITTTKDNEDWCYRTEDEARSESRATDIRVAVHMREVIE